MVWLVEIGGTYSESVMFIQHAVLSHFQAYSMILFDK